MMEQGKSAEREEMHGQGGIYEQKKANLLWIDLEMTGLDPEKDRILEVAAVATGWDLQPLAEMTAVVKVPEELMRERMVGEFWEKNAESRAGLMAQNATGESAEAVEMQLLGLVEEWFGEEVILAGNSIHQDRKFMDREWPQLAAKLHYRMLDVSASPVAAVPSTVTLPPSPAMSRPSETSSPSPRISI